LRSDIKEDQDALKQIIQVVGQTHIDLAEVLGWLGEKASQVKLRQDGPAAGLGTFEALEALTLGIRGKLALWRCLPLIRDGDARVPPLDFDALADRAEKQFAATEHQRLSLVPVTFGSKATSKVEVQPR
jgi:hypothetical protein